MARREPTGWITVEGNHVPLFKGESKKEAVERFIAIKQQVKDEQDKKEKQIKQNENEAKKKNSDSEIAKFEKEAKRQGSDLTVADIEDYVSSSYGNHRLGDRISKFIDNAPENMKVGDVETYRGMYFNSKSDYENFIKSHTEGKILESRRDGLSWTTDRKVADEFGKNAGDYSVLLVDGDEAKNAISIKGIADTPASSSEVLYSSSQDFEVMEVERKGNTAILYVTAAVVSKRKY